MVAGMRRPASSRSEPAALAQTRNTIFCDSEYSDGVAVNGNGIACTVDEDGLLDFGGNDCSQERPMASSTSTKHPP